MTIRSGTIAIVGSLAILPVLAAMGFLTGLRVNLTPSYPLGLWRIQPLSRAVAVGDRIIICPPKAEVFELARERGYIGRGLCPGWFSPLIKTVVAVAGQHVVVDDNIAVDGAPIAHSSVRRADGEGRVLVPDAGGVVPDGKLFLFSEFAGSYDSRYFGSIPATGILGLARPLLVLDP